MFPQIATGLILAAALVLPALPADSQAGNPTGRTEAWSGCELYGSVVTPATFRPNGEAFDELYMNPNGYRDGVNLISDAAPRDRDYNGGRWHLNVLKGSVDPTKYDDACSASELDPADFESTDTYFECPLTPRRGRR